MDDLISRQAAIDAIEEYADRLQMVDWKENPGVPYKAYALNWCINTIRDLPPAQPDIKQATKLLLDFIKSCPGGDSYLITPDGEELRTDWGYATEGIQLIHDWAERRTDG